MAALTHERERSAVSGGEGAPAPSPNGTRPAARSEARRPPRGEAPSAHEYRAELIVGLSFVAAATAVALLGDSGRSLELGPAIALVLAYGALSRVRFHAGAGHTVPTQLVFVPMLFILPTELVPLLVLAGMVAGNLPDYLRGVLHPGRALMLLGDAWHAVGPAAVLLAAGAVVPTWGEWPWYVVALAAQFAVDFSVYAARARLALDIPGRDQLRVLAWVWLVDALLAPVGLLAAFATVGYPYAFALVLPLALLLKLFARERNERIDQALELGGAYRGIAMLLGDLLEEADEYTGGDHTRGVVALSLEVAEELGLDERQRHNVELAALLHDIGKIVIPDTIINKPGPLDDERVGADEDAHDRGPAHARPRRRRAARGRDDRARLTRALGRRRLSGRARRRADPARGDGRRGLRRLQRDDDRPLLPPRPLDGRGTGGAARQCRASVRAGRRRGHRARRRAQHAGRLVGPRDRAQVDVPERDRRRAARGLAEVAALVGERRLRARRPSGRCAPAAPRATRRSSGSASRICTSGAFAIASITDSSPTVKQASGSPAGVGRSRRRPARTCAPAAAR